jgi:hypothetical protein
MPKAYHCGIAIPRARFAALSFPTRLRGPLIAEPGPAVFRLLDLAGVIQLRF